MKFLRCKNYIYPSCKWVNSQDEKQAQFFSPSINHMDASKSKKEFPELFIKESLEASVLIV